MADYQLTAGNVVRVRCVSDSRWCGARVELASKTNPQSAVFRLNGCVGDGRGGVVVGFLPVIIDYTAGTVEGVFGGAYEVEVTSGLHARMGFGMI